MAILNNDTDGIKAAIYVRVSTDDQTYENQLPHLQDWAARRGMEVTGIYAENASAWHEGHQRELARLIGDAYKRKFDCILVWALDRVSREGPLRILEFMHKLRTWGIKLYSYNEAWTEAPGELGDLLYSITAWVSKFYCDRISVNTKAGIERRRRAGKPIGRPEGSPGSGAGLSRVDRELV